MDSRKLVTATLLGVAIAAVKSPFTFPITDYLIIVEVPVLGLSYLILGRGGATYTGFINGALQSAVKVGFFPFDLLFGVSYGVLVDLFCVLLKVRTNGSTSSKRMMSALGIASTILGVGIAYVFLAFNLNLGINLSQYSTTDLLEIVYLPILVWGIFSGVLGGFFAARVWERNLKARFKSVQPSMN